MREDGGSNSKGESDRDRGGRSYMTTNREYLKKIPERLSEREYEFEMKEKKLEKRALGQ